MTPASLTAIRPEGSEVAETTSARAGTVSTGRAVADLLRSDASHGGELRVVVRGSCMVPHLSDGSTVTVAVGRRVFPGDVVAVVGDDHHVRVHRLLGWVPRRRQPPLVLTKADAARAVDQPVATDALLGPVVTLRPALSVRLRALWQWGTVVCMAMSRRLRGTS